MYKIVTKNCFHREVLCFHCCNFYIFLGGGLIYFCTYDNLVGIMRKYRVIYLTPQKDPPKDFEKSAAEIVAEYFKTDIIFQRQEILKTPDLIIKNQVWELKSPRGDGKYTIHNSFMTARKQSTNIIVDLRRCKMHEQKAFARIREAYGKRRRKTGRYIIIDKRGKVLDVMELV